MRISRSAVSPGSDPDAGRHRLLLMIASFLASRAYSDFMDAKQEVPRRTPLADLSADRLPARLRHRLFVVGPAGPACLGHRRRGIPPPARRVASARAVLRRAVRHRRRRGRARNVVDSRLADRNGFPARHPLHLQAAPHPRAPHPLPRPHDHRRPLSGSWIRPAPAVDLTALVTDRAFSPGSAVPTRAQPSAASPRQEATNPARGGSQKAAATAGAAPYARRRRARRIARPNLPSGLPYCACPGGGTRSTGSRSLGCAGAR